MSDEAPEIGQNRELAGFGMGTGSAREQSASPHIRTPAGHGLSIRTVSSGESHTRGTGTSATQPLSSQLVERSVDLHPTLLEILRQYEGGAVSFVRTHRKGESYLDGLQGLTDLEQDTLSLEFTEALNRTDRRRDELQEGGGREGGVGGEEAEVSRSDWGEDGGREGGFRVGRRGGGIREDKCPWYKRRERNSNTQRESQKKTRDIIQYLRDDIGTAVQWVKSAEDGPKHFPDSEWVNIIKGKSIDLGKVLASQYVSRPVPENVGSVGGIEFRFPGKERSRKVESISDWHIAWQAAAEATGVVFPHRERELAQYGSYIFQKFKRRNPMYHAQVIVFDEAIRETVGGGEHRSLLDPEICAEFDEAILFPTGAEYHFASSRGNRKGQLCNRFNGKFGCENQNCAYEHKCRACKDSGHGQFGCTKGGVEGKGPKAKVSQV